MMRGPLKWSVVGLCAVFAFTGATWLSFHRADIPYEDLEALYEQPVSEYARLPNGLLVHYTDEGPRDAPVLLLVHGLASASQSWMAWRDDLKEDYRVISVDLPGHGLTRVLETTDLSTAGLVDFLSRFSTRLNLDEFVLVGASLGGHIGWEYALRHSDNLSGLVLIAPAGLSSPDEAREHAALASDIVNNPVVSALAVTLDPAIAIRRGFVAASGEAAPNETVRQYTDFARAPGHREALLRVSARTDGASDDALERLQSLSLPILVLQGEGDEIVPADHARRFVEAVPQAELVIYTDVGHLPHEQIPDVTLTDLRAFLNTLAPDEEPPQPETAGPEIPVSED